MLVKFTLRSSLLENRHRVRLLYGQYVGRAERFIVKLTGYGTTASFRIWRRVVSIVQ
jgi:hypothetical protein